jgi:6-phosphogluconolactonase (cycloisomerase 2 family)
MEVSPERRPMRHQRFSRIVVGVGLGLSLFLAGCGGSSGTSGTEFATQSRFGAGGVGLAGGGNGGLDGIGGPNNVGPGTGNPVDFVPGGGGGGALSPIPPASIEASTPGTLILGIGDQEPLELLITLGDGSTVSINQGLGAQAIETTVEGVALTYESLDPLVVTIDEDAILTGVGPGNTIVRVTATSGTEENRATVALDVPVSVGVPNQFLYVANPTPNGGGGWITILGIFEDGILGVVEDRIDNTGRPLGVFADPAGEFVYAVNVLGDDITPYAVTQGTGLLTPIGTTSIPAGDSPRGLAFAEVNGQTYAYTANFNGNLIGYQLESDGLLTPLNGFPVASGTSFAAPTVGPNRDRIYTSNTGSGTIGVYAVGNDGSLTLQSTAAAQSRPFDLAFSPDGDFAYVTNESSATITCYSVSANGDLIPLDPASVSTGPSTFGLTAHPLLPYVYATSGGDQTVTTYAINTATGALTEIDVDDSGPGPGSPVIDLTGTSMYIMRGDYDFSTYTIANDGTLTRGADFDDPSIESGFARTGVIIDNTFNQAVDLLDGEQERRHFAVGL